MTGNNIEVTPAMREYVQKKLGKVHTRTRLLLLLSNWSSADAGMDRRRPRAPAGTKPRTHRPQTPNPKPPNQTPHTYLQQVLAKLPLHDAVQRVDVHLSVVVVAHAAKHSHTCEATVFMKGGQVRLLWRAVWSILSHTRVTRQPKRKSQPSRCCARRRRRITCTRPSTWSPTG